MKLRKSIIAILLCASISGCASSRLYPLCQFNGAVETAQLQRLENDLTSVFKLSIKEPKKYKFAEDHRYVVVNTYNRTHKDLSKMWPILGCLGTYQSSDSQKKYLACMKYIEFFLASETSAITEAEALCYFTDQEAERCNGRTEDTVDPVIYCNGR